jgi:tRNA (guanine-N7-)-methyltransferase
MAKNKLHHYNEINNFSNVVQVKPHLNEGVEYKGLWAKKYFKNSNPIIVELACGKGEYTLGLARLNPHINYLGIDIKGARIWKGAKTALEEKLANVGFLRIMIEWLEHCFDKEELSQIWITFADPFLSTTKEHKRLTSPKFLEIYNRLLSHNGLVHLKTDDDTLYKFTIEVANGTFTINKYPFDVTSHFELKKHDDDIYKNGENENPLLNIKTYYERKHLINGKKIKYVQLQKKNT